jgi:hypothetical protein
LRKYNKEFFFYFFMIRKVTKKSSAASKPHQPRRSALSVDKTFDMMP